MIPLNDASFRVIKHIAETQEEIFEYAISNGYLMDDFIEKYMSSNFCNREMDSPDSYFHFKTPEVCFSYLKNELHDFKKGKNDFYDVGWVAKMYRYLAYFLEASSLTVYNLIRPHELDAFAISCELLNEKDAIEEIIKKSILPKLCIFNQLNFISPHRISIHSPNRAFSKSWISSSEGSLSSCKSHSLTKYNMPIT